jgi:hypothetical protein
MDHRPDFVPGSPRTGSMLVNGQAQVLKIRMEGSQQLLQLRELQSPMLLQTFLEGTVHTVECNMAAHGAHSFTSKTKVSGQGRKIDAGNTAPGAGRLQRDDEPEQTHCRVFRQNASAKLSAFEFDPDSLSRAGGMTWRRLSALFGKRTSAARENPEFCSH